MKLLGVAVEGRRRASRAWRVHPTMVRKDSAIGPGDGRDRCRSPVDAEGPSIRSRWIGPGAGGNCASAVLLRHRRYRPRRAHFFRAVSGHCGARGSKACARRRCSATRAATTSGCSRATAPEPATIAKRLAQQEISLEHPLCSATMGAPTWTQGASSPSSSLPMRQLEDAVRKALAAVGRDRVISGKPQVIRIEKN